MNRQTIVQTAIALLTYTLLGVYFIFRVYTVYESYQVLGVSIDMLVVILFWFAEAFIVIQSSNYFYDLFRAFYGYKYTLNDMPFGVTGVRPDVDVLIPVHNEPVGIVRRTLFAATRIDYENKTVHLIDGSDKEESIRQMQGLTEEMGVNYYSVPYPRHGAKAGAINEFLQESVAPYIVIFDADYRASKDFLRVLVWQMEADPDLAYIQTPQFYGNLLESYTSRAAQMQQSIFYEYISEAKSMDNANFMCGTNLIIRVEALKDVGGFDESTITEDYSTSVNLHSRGWKSRYDNYTTAFGNGPGNLAEYFKQQYRWAKGNFDTMKLKLMPMIFSSRLTISQKREYIMSGTYYLIGWARLTIILSPVLFILFGLPSYLTSPELYLLSYVPYFTVTTILFYESLFIRKYPFREWVLGESLTFLSIPVFLKASLDSFLGRKSTFQTTDKSAEVDVYTLRQLRPQLLIIGVNLLAAVVGVYKLASGNQDWGIAINLFWVVFHLFFISYLLAILWYARRQQEKNYRS
ncbi:MAG: Cellulose synthase 1 [candidate division WS6 bacterium OLB20]|uniref:Cellulose synthase 1 n=1 Tax=candidate division WS6 bacterium OLB20 TaxID=1617426 RepID=A0A136M0E6_9BACT|nr:MAG: Cellulose synthase 1 [candidate division WS6 bacterium OLB20]